MIVSIDKDWETYASIIYLNTSPHLGAERIKVGTNKKRDVFAVKDLLEWQDKERAELRKICREHGILFKTVNGCFVDWQCYFDDTEDATQGLPEIYRRHKRASCQERFERCIGQSRTTGEGNAARC